MTSPAFHELQDLAPVTLPSHLCRMCERETAEFFCSHNCRTAWWLEQTSTRNFWADFLLRPPAQKTLKKD